MARSGFNYGASSFLSSAGLPGFWSHATLVAEGAHRQYRTRCALPVPQQAVARIFAETGAGTSEVVDRLEVHSRAAA